MIIAYYKHYNKCDIVRGIINCTLKVCVSLYMTVRHAPVKKGESYSEQYTLTRQNNNNQTIININCNT
jgi:hypothetical protein